MAKLTNNQKKGNFKVITRYHFTCIILTKLKRTANSDCCWDTENINSKHTCENINLTTFGRSNQEISIKNKKYMCILTQ